MMQRRDSIARRCEGICRHLGSVALVAAGMTMPATVLGVEPDEPEEARLVREAHEAAREAEDLAVRARAAAARAEAAARRARAAALEMSGERAQPARETDDGRDSPRFAQSPPATSPSTDGPTIGQASTDDVGPSPTTPNQRVPFPPVIATPSLAPIIDRKPLEQLLLVPTEAKPNGVLGLKQAYQELNAIPAASRDAPLIKMTRPLALKFSVDPRAPGYLSRVQLTADRDGGNATLRLSFPSQANNDRGLTRDITLSSPLSKQSDNTQLATLDGLANAAAIGFKLGYYTSDATSTVSPVHYAGISGRYGVEEHSFVDPGTLETGSGQRRPRSLSAILGITSSGEGRGAAAVVFDYQQVYPDAATGVLCPAFTTGITACASGSIGAPARTIRRNLTLQGRYRAPLFELDPSITFDAVGRRTAIELPVYFIKDATANSGSDYAGGLKLSWRSDLHRFVVGLVVGAPFTGPWDQ